MTLQDKLLKHTLVLLYLCLNTGFSDFRTHLWGHQGENLCKDNVTGESKKDMIAEHGEPHHPLEVCDVLRGGGNALLTHDNGADYVIARR